MRSQRERDEQTLDIVAAAFGAALLWGVPVAVIAVLADRTGLELTGDAATAAVAAVAVLYVATVVLLLGRSDR